MSDAAELERLRAIADTFVEEIGAAEPVTPEPYRLTVRDLQDATAAWPKLDLSREQLADLFAVGAQDTLAYDDRAELTVLSCAVGAIRAIHTDLFRERGIAIARRLGEEAFAPMRRELARRICGSSTPPNFLVLSREGDRLADGRVAAEHRSMMWALAFVSTDEVAALDVAEDRLRDLRDRRRVLDLAALIARAGGESEPETVAKLNRALQSVRRLIENGGAHVLAA